MAQQFAKVEQPTKAMTRAMEQAKQKVRDLSQQEREMVARHGSLKRAMSEAGINTKQLGQHQRQLKSDLAAANSQLDQQRAKLGQLADQQKRLNQIKANYVKPCRCAALWRAMALRAWPRGRRHLQGHQYRGQGDGL